LLPAPTAPSEGSAGVRNLVDRTFRTIYPLSILAHQLRRRFPSCRSLFRGARLLYSTALPGGSLVFPVARPGFLKTADLKISSLSAPKRLMFRGPSWIDHSRVPLRSPYPTRRSGSRVALEKIDSSGASSRLDPKRTRKFFSLSCRRRSVLLSPAAFFKSFPTFPKGPALPSRSPDPYGPIVRVAEAEFSVTALWITGISGTSTRLPRLSIGCRSETAALPRKECLTRLLQAQNRLISRV
jgi:hypothetical protein